MGNLAGSASGRAAGGSSSPLANPQMAQMGGQMMMQNGMGGMAQQEALLTNLARMGPPPTMNTAGAPQAGQDIVGKYGAQMRPPNVNYRSRQDVQMNPSIGQMLTGVA